MEAIPRRVCRVGVGVVAIVVLAVAAYALVQDMAPPSLHTHGYQDGGSGLRAAIILGVSIYGGRWIARRIVPFHTSPTVPPADLLPQADDHGP